MSLFCRKTVFVRHCRFFRKLPQAPDSAVVEVSETAAKLSHIPVMVKEVIQNLNLKEGDLLLDMTFGAGGHSEALLEEIPNLQVFALDRDPTVLQFASELEKKYPGQIIPLIGKFSDLPSILENHLVKENTFDGVLFDLGCSSMQLDNAERGFSFSKDGPLDMRMGTDTELTAADVLAYANEEDLKKIFKIYGGEKKAIKLTQAIVQARAVFKPLQRTTQLTDLVETVLEGHQRKDKLNRKANVSTKVFQALRMFVNNEINELDYGIRLVHKYLKPGGRAAVITFHSGEDQIVKRHFKNLPVDNKVGALPLVYFNFAKDFTEEEIKDFQPKHWQAVNKNVIVPTKEEVETNPRSRSSKLRVAFKLES